MAKTESTAVNELIDLVQNGKQDAAPEPAADLFSAPRSTRVSPPRMTSPIPPMRGAGEVQPLPRQRAPHSTSQLLPTPVRMSTADPTRGNTIPPLSRQTTRPSPPPSRATSANPAVRATSSNPAMRASAPALPPPRTTPRSSTQQPVQRPSAPAARASSPRATASVPVQQRPTVPSVPSLPPRTAPVAAPFEARSENPFAALPAVPQQYPILARPQTVDVTGDLVKADNWFDVSAAVHKIDADGTAVVVRPNPGTLALIKKLIVPTILLAIVGVMIGGYFAFDGDGGKRKKPSAAPAGVAQTAAEQRVAMSAAPTEAEPTTPATAAATETPAAAAEAEPPTKAEQIAKQEAAAADETTSMLPAATTAAITKQPAPAAAPAAAAPAVAVAAAPPAAAPPAAAPPAPAPAKTELAKPAPPPAAAPAPAPVKAVATSSEPSAVREVQTPRGVVKLVDVRIDSKPSGATVMLVDNGKTSFLGTTPLATSLDPSRKYDVIFTLAGRPTQMAPLEPGKTSRLDVTLGRAKSSRSAKKATSSLGDSFIDKSGGSIAAPSASLRDKSVATPPEVKAEPPKAEPKQVDKADKPAKAVVEKKTAPAGDGTLMVSSKPPCEILIDGKSTGLTTPQRSIPLSAGMHKITFVNATEGIKKTVSVSITADQSTKLIQDLMKK